MTTASYPNSLVQAADLTVQQPTGDATYEQVDRIIDSSSKDTPEGIHLSSGQKITVKKGGTISINKNSTTNYGLWATDGGKNGSYLTFTGGQLDINIDNSAQTGGNRINGVFCYSGYNPFPGTPTAPYKGSTITLNDTNITMKGSSYVLGITAGSDFGNNSNGGG